MQTLQNLFWDSQHKRPRALWRLLAQLAAWQLLFAILTGLWVALSNLGITAFGLPSPEGEVLVWLFVLVSLIASVVWAGRFLDRRRFVDFGFHLYRNWWLNFAFGLALGALLMVVIFLLELAAGWLTVTGTFVTRESELPFFLLIFAPLATYLAVGFCEELFSRGYHVKNMAEGLNLPALGPSAAVLLAWLLSSLIFGILHFANPNATPISTLNLVVAGLGLGLGYLLTGELAIPIGLHITWNFVQGNVFGFPVSGLPPRFATFIATQQDGPALWTGGDFGPEAGLLGLLATLLGALLTLLWVRWRYGSVHLHTALADYQPVQAAITPQL